MRRHKVTHEFQAQELSGPFHRTITTREELEFLRYAGEENEAVVFAVLIGGHDGSVMPGPEYEVTRDLFEASTEPATQI
jgi:hypothetical protein